MIVENGAVNRASVLGLSGLGHFGRMDRVRLSTASVPC